MELRRLGTELGGYIDKVAVLQSEVSLWPRLTHGV